MIHGLDAFRLMIGLLEASKSLDGCGFDGVSTDRLFCRVEGDGFCERVWGL